MTNDEARNNDEVGITGCHPERSEAQSKDPAELLFGFATGLKAWPRPESFRGCVAASTSLGTTVSLFVIRRVGLPSTFVIRTSSFPPHLPVFNETIWNFLQK